MQVWHTKNAQSGFHMFGITYLPLDENIKNCFYFLWNSCLKKKYGSMLSVLLCSYDKGFSYASVCLQDKHLIISRLDSLFCFPNQLYISFCTFKCVQQTLPGNFPLRISKLVLEQSVCCHFIYLNKHDNRKMQLLTAMLWNMNC